MGRREFYAWVDQCHKEVIEASEESPDSWRNTEKNSWWERAREKRRKMQGH